MGISASVGLISGLDTESIISALINAESTPITLLQQKQAVYEAKISSYGLVKSSLSNLQSAISTLADSATYAAGYSSSSSNEDILTAAVSDDDSASAGTYRIVVNQLATSAQMTSFSYGDSASDVGSGTLHFQVGDGEKQSIAIDEDNQSLEDIANAINEAGLDVSASVLRVADGDYRLAITAKDTGKDISFSYQESGFAFETTTQAGSTSGEVMQSESFASDSTALGITGTLSVNGTDITLDGTESLNDIQASVNAIDGISASVEYDSESGTYRLSVENDTAEGTLELNYSDSDAAGGFSNFLDPDATVAAKKALLNINNIDVERESNTIDDLIGGVTLNLTNEDPDSTVTVSVSSNYDTASEAMDAFVSAYNSTVSTLASLQSYDSESGESGNLQGDSTTNVLRSGLSRMIFSSFSGLSSGLSSLSDLGIELEDTGELTFDNSTFTAAMNADGDDVVDMLTRDTGSSKGLAVQLETFLEGYLKSNGGILETKIEGYTNSSSRIDTNIESIERRLATREENLRSQFANLEQILATYTSTATYLSNQLTVISNMTSSFY